MSLNKVIVMGRIGRDIELKQLQSGTSMCKLSIACSEKIKDNDGNYSEHTEWINAVAFGKRAEVIAKYMGKGDEILIEGSLKTTSWEKDGVKRYNTDVIVSNFSFVGSKKSGGGQSGGSDGIPF